MQPLGERLFDAGSTAMTELREFGLPRGNFEQSAARACNGASQHANKQPWGTKTHAAPILLLPRLVGKLFENDSVAHGYDLMDLFAMQTLAVGSQLALFAGTPLPDFLVGAAAFPVQPLLAVLPNTAVFIVVVRVSRPALPLHLALEPADVLLIRGQLLTEQFQARFVFAGHQSNGGGSQVCSDGITSHGVFRLVVRHAFQSQLHTVAKAKGIGSLRLWAACLALEETRIFDTMIQSVLDAE
jgi:hypothetical protein